MPTTPPSKKAFVYTVGKDILNEGVVQSSPDWLVAFYPLTTRDTKNAPENITPQFVRDPVIVRNDCVAVKIDSNKSTPFGNADLTLKSGNINYLTSVAPGDYVFVWMHTDPAVLDEVEKNLIARKPANDFHSGLKFFGRLESIRERLGVTAQGVKTLTYSITASSFGEFNSSIYLNPNYEKTKVIQELFFTSYAGAKSARQTTLPIGVDDVVLEFLNIFLGAGPLDLLAGDAAKEVAFATGSKGMFLSGHIASVFGRGEFGAVTKYTNILSVMQGIQTYRNRNAANDPAGFVPLLPTRVAKHFYRTGVRNSGIQIFIVDNWNGQSVWSMLYRYSNEVVNEMYTTLRVGVDGKITPHFIMRQIPFSTQEYLKNLAKDQSSSEYKTVTLFMNLPRWKIPEEMVLSHDIGRSNALRVNFVQVWGTIVGKEITTNIQLPINFKIDGKDFSRSGPRVLVKSSDKDYLADSPTNTLSDASKVGTWSSKLADWAINGHLKLNGTLTSVGISEPICIGDNLEWNGIVYHIESVSHACQIAPNGSKIFRTSLTFSNGLDARTENPAGTTVYPYMDDEFRENVDANNTNQIYPGYSNTQETSPDYDKDGNLIKDRVGINLTRLPKKK